MDTALGGEGACSRWAAQQPQTALTNEFETPRRQISGPLHAPAGASSLATSFPFAPDENPTIKKGHPKAALKN